MFYCNWSAHHRWTSYDLHIYTICERAIKSTSKLTQKREKKKWSESHSTYNISTTTADFSFIKNSPRGRIKWKKKTLENWEWDSPSIFHSTGYIIYVLIKKHQSRGRIFHRQWVELSDYFMPPLKPSLSPVRHRLITTRSVAFTSFSPLDGGRLLARTRCSVA